MLKIDNRKALHRLADKSFRANRGRNLIAILAIILTTILFTSVFSIGGNLIASFQYSTMLQSGGSAHGTFKDLTQEQFDRLKQAAPAGAILDRNIICAYEVENPEFLKRHLELWYQPPEAYERRFCQLTGGRAPQAADEIAMDERSLELLGITPEEGQTITLQLKMGYDQPVIERQFTLVGWFGYSDIMNTGFGIVSEAYLTEHAGELAEASEQTGSQVGLIQCDVTFSNGINISGKLRAMAEKAGFAEEVEWNENWAYVGAGITDWTSIGAVAGLLLLIMLTGYLIIYNIFQISVMQDIRYYGLLKTIGTTAKQIRRILRRQALVLCGFGIPVGLVLGFLLGTAFTPLILQMVNTVDDVKLALNPAVFLGAAAFSVITVLLSMRKPARLAAKVSPVEAVRYTEGNGRTAKKAKRSTGGGKLWRMALSNVGRNKRRAVLVVLSMSLSLVLMNSVFTLTGSFDMDKYLARFIKTDFVIANARYWGIDSFRALDGEDAVSDTLIANVQAQEGFVQGGAIWCDIYSWTEEYQWPEDTIWDEAGNPCRSDGRNRPQAVDDAKNPFTVIYGADDFILDNLQIMEGERDPETIQQKLATGEYILFAGQVNDEGKLEPDQRHKVGDVVTLYDADGARHTFTILSVINPAYYCETAQASFSEFVYYTTADVYAEMCNTANKMNYAFEVEPESVEAMEQYLNLYTTQIDPLMDYRSRDGYIQEYSGIRFLFVAVGGSLSRVIGLIGVLNFINSILTGIITRRREFSMLEAIGMTRRQLQTMVALEGSCYALFTILCSLGVGVGVSLLCVKPLVDSLFFTSYRFVIWPLLAAIPVLAVLGIAIPRLALHFGAGQPVVERMRQAE